MNKLISERIQFDDALNVAVIDGIKVHGDLFSAFTTVTKPGDWFRVRERANGIVTITVRHDKTDLDPPSYWLNPATGRCLSPEELETMRTADPSIVKQFTVRLDERVGHG